MASTLAIRTPDGAQRTVPLEKSRISVGRAHENDLRFPDDTSLSRHHLVLERDEEGWTIRDLGSKNGTFVNDQRVEGRLRLRPGDRIAVGHVAMRLDEPPGDSSANVTFYPDAPAEIPGHETVVSSLEGLLSPGDRTPSTGPGVSARTSGERKSFDSTAVSALLRAGRELALRRPLPELFQIILDLSIESVRAERGVLLTVERDGGLEPRAMRGEDFRISAAVRDRVLGSRQSLLVRDARLDEVLRGRVSINEQNVRTLMAVPLQTNDRVIGLIYVDTRGLVSAPTPNDLDLLTVLANVAANRIEQERLALVEEKERIQAQELEQAAEIQRGLLPRSAPDVTGVELAGHNAQCRTVGGDYYEFLPTGDGRVALVLADVSGKGLPAALLMADLRAKIQVLAEEPDDLPRLMARLDRLMERSCPPNRFVTCFFCILDPATGRLRYSNAGHNPPLLVREGGAVEELRGGGAPLGMLPGLGYEERECRVLPGDLLVLYSDGVTECENPVGEEFGAGRLVEVLLGLRGVPASVAADRVCRALAEWSSGAPPTDDLTFIVAKRS